MQHGHVVIMLETESDAVGVELVHGPFASYDEASRVADEIAARSGKTRGVEVQVCPLTAPVE